MVLAKQEYAQTMAGASGMEYHMIAGKDAEAGRIGMLFGEVSAEQHSIHLK